MVRLPHRRLCLSGRPGFTLLEMMIVLVLMSLITSLVLPRLDKLYSGIFASFSRSDVLQSIADLGYNGMARGKTIVLTDTVSGPNRDTAADSASSAALVLPDGWKVLVKEPIVYLKNGVCLGGTLRLFHGANGVPYLLSPPYCVPVEMERGEVTDE